MANLYDIDKKIILDGEKLKYDVNSSSGGNSIGEVDKEDPHQGDVIVLDLPKPKGKSAVKKREIDLGIEPLKNFEDKMKKLQENRKRMRASKQSDLGALVSQLEADGAAIRERNKKVLALGRQQLELAQRARTAHMQRLQAMREIYDYIKGWEDTETQHSEASRRSREQLAAKFKELQQSSADDNRRKSAHALKEAMSMIYSQYSK